MTNRISSLSGWQRIGLVLSTIWILLIGLIGLSIFTRAPAGWQEYFILFLMLVVPIALMYACAYVARWIVRGFRAQR